MTECPFLSFFLLLWVLGSGPGRIIGDGIMRERKRGRFLSRHWDESAAPVKVKYGESKIPRHAQKCGQNTAGTRLRMAAGSGPKFYAFSSPKLKITHGVCRRSTCLQSKLYTSGWERYRGQDFSRGLNRVQNLSPSSAGGSLRGDDIQHSQYW